MSQPWLSVITAVRDDDEGLQRTIHSLRMQNLNDVEVKIIDSSQERGQVRRIVSDLGEVEWTEPSGIYPAMNTGLATARGQYVYFLNAGDVLHAPDVLARVQQVSLEGPKWMFGPVEIVATDGKRTVTPPWNYATEKATHFSRGHFPQHQGTFAQTELLRQLGGFSTKYRIAADYAAFLKLSRISDPTELDFVIANFFEGGVSTTHWRASIKEFHHARRSEFDLHGFSAVREWVHTAAQTARVWIYRDVAQPLKRIARR